MGRGGFAAGLLIGGLGGLAAGYVLSHNGASGEDGDVTSIDLTPSIELNRNRRRTPKASPAAGSKENIEE